MDERDREIRDRLARHDGWPAVSVYLPAHRAGSETLQDPIRLKNLLTEAGEALVRIGMRTPESEGFPREAWKLQRDPAFMTLRSHPDNGDIDLLDHVAAATLTHGGTVHVLPAEQVRKATGSDAAAVFRY